MQQLNYVQPSATAMNAAFLALYKSELPKFKRHIQQCGWDMHEQTVSKLFFMQVDEAYVSARPKILFIGRETFGWDTFNELDKADDLMNFYKSISDGGEHYNSPFWWFREGFSQALGINKEVFMRATLWTNLSKIDVNKAKPTGKPFNALMQAFIDLLVAEIEIVKPDVVLIMTKDGFYNWHLDHYR